MHTTEDSRRRLLPLVFALFIPGALFGLFLAFHQALQPLRGQDFQWSGTWMVWHHIDPWKQMLSGDRHLILLNQVPNYLHETYVVLAPFGWMSFQHARVIWAVTNCLFALTSVYLIGRFFNLGARLTWLLALVFFTGYPFRTSLGNGQQSFLELLAFCGALSLRTLPARSVALGLSYVKYSFAPVLVFYLLFRKHWRLLALSLILPVSGFLIVWCMVRTSPIDLAMEPFRVSRNGIVVTAADLMALTRWLGPHLVPMHLVEAVSYTVGLGGSALYGLHLAKSTWLSERVVFTCLATSSLVLMRHGFYDFIFLIVPIANLRYLATIASKFISAFILAFFWYGERLSTLFSVNARMVVDLVLIALLLYLVEYNERAPLTPAPLPTR